MIQKFKLNSENKDYVIPLKYLPIVGSVELWDQLEDFYGKEQENNPETKPHPYYSNDTIISTKIYGISVSGIVNYEYKFIQLNFESDPGDILINIKYETYEEENI